MNIFKKLISSIFGVCAKQKYKKSNMINLILFGPPGSGKGTQAAKLVEKYGFVHISTGDLFRYEIGNNTPLGRKAKSFMDKGRLVPDEVTIGMLENKINMSPDAKGFILDGFPRTLPQSEALDQFLAGKDQQVSGLIALEVEEEEIVQRLLKRGETSGRPDDANEEVIRKRIAVYLEETAIVYDYYKRKDLSVTINGLGTIDEIFERLSSKIDSL